MKYLSSIISSSVGNIIEWYDFGLFTIFSALFSKLFFPNDNPQLALIATFSIFSIGFFFRPLGALIFGYLGDKKGRAQTLRLSILMITLPTLLIGILPTYQQGGILAPLLLMLIRIWQGISIGGEYGGNLVYLAETSPTRYRATFTSLASMGSNLGILLATLVGITTSLFISPRILNDWGWRIPYLLSGILCLFIYRYRLNLQETQVFNYLKQHAQIPQNPLKILFKENLPALFRTLGLVCMGSTFYYFNFIYLPYFLTENHHLSIQSVSLLISMCMGLMILIIPLVGFLCDIIGRKKLFLFNVILIMLITIPGFYYLKQSNLILIILFLFTLASSFEQGTTGVVIVENFPLPARYTGLALAYNLANGFLGSTVPLVCGWLLIDKPFGLLPAIYITGCAMITGLVLIFFTPETRGCDLA